MKIDQAAPDGLVAALRERKARMLSSAKIDDRRAVALLRFIDDVPDGCGRNVLVFVKDAEETKVGLSDEAIDALTDVLQKRRDMMLREQFEWVPALPTDQQ